MNLNFRIPLRNARILACCLAMLAFGLLIPCQGAEDVVSDPVGMMRVAVPSNTCLMVAMPFDAVSNSINAVLQGQLCGASAESNADRMLMWNAVNQEYAIAFKADDTGDSQKDGYWFESGTNWVLSELTLSAGDGFWIDSRHAGQNLYLLGNVVLCPTQYVELEAGLNAVVFPFPAAFDLNGSSLAEDGALGGTNWSLADNFITGNDSNRFWLLSQAGHQWDGQWLTMSNQPVENAFELGKPFWYDRAAASGMTWSIIRSCGEPPVLGSNTPQIVDMSYNSSSQAVMLVLSCTSSVEALLEVFYQDLSTTESMTMESNWLSAVQDIAVSNQESVTWIDNGSGDRCAVTQAFCRIYMVARQDIDTDTDALSDAFEQYVQQTDETVADTDQDGLSDGEEVLEEGTNPLKPDTDDDCMADGVELTWTQDPTSSNDYAQLPWSEDFEGLATGTVHQQNGWTADPQQGALIQQGGYVSATSSLKFVTGEQTATRHLFGAHGATNVWVDMWLYAQAGVLPDVTALTNNPWSALVAVNPDGRVCAYDGLMSEWQTVTNGSAVTGQWVRLTVCLNYGDRTWRLNGDNMLLLKNLGFFDYNNTAFACIDWLGSTLKSTYLDDVTITTEEPSHLDDDIDGIPNVWEKLYGLDPENSSDATADLDDDGLTCLEEYPLNSDPKMSDTDADGMLDGTEAFWEQDLLNSNDWPVAPWEYGFEISEGFTNGGLDGQLGWFVSGGVAEIQTNQVASGAQAAQLTPLQTTNALLSHWSVCSTGDTVWTHADLLLTPGELSEAVSVEGRSVVIAVNEQGYIACYDGSLEDWVVASNSPVYDLESWLSLTVCADYSSRSYCLYCEGIPIISASFADLSVRQMSRFDIETGNSLGDGLDNAQTLLTKPVYIDEDIDGLTDLQEDTNQNSMVDSGETDPDDNDSDNDKMDDGREQDWAFNPLSSNLYAQLSWSAGFETSAGYSNGLLNGQMLWDASSSVILQSNNVYDGICAVALSNTGTTEVAMLQYFGACDEKTVWIDSYTIMQPGVLPNATDLTDAHAILYAVNPSGLPCAYDGKRKSWQVAVYDFRVDDNDWYRCTFALDYAHKTWSMYLDGTRIFKDIAFADSDIRSLSRIGITAPADHSGTAYVDALEAGISEPAGLDNDGDGMFNAWEREHGLDTENAQDALTDLDEDGLNNLEEFYAGSNPTLVDTDSDGVSDYVEVRQAYSNPADNDYDGSVSVLSELKGSNYVQSSGNWKRWFDTAVSDGIRGGLDYGFSVANDGVYQVEVFVRGLGLPSTRFNASVDNHELGDTMVDIEYENLNSFSFITPTLSAGQHTLHIFWDNVLPQTKMIVERICVQTVNGADNNSNGRADWIDYRFLQTAHFANTNIESLVSPCCVEGKALFIEDMFLSDGTLPHSGVGINWYADIELSATNTKQVTAVFENGAITQDCSLTWREFNILEQQDITLRLNDQLLLTAYPAGAVTGEVYVSVGSIANYDTTVSSPAEHTFDQAGQYEIEGTYVLAGVTQQNTLVVNVIDACFPTNTPAAWEGKTRTWTCPDIYADQVVFEADPLLDYQVDPAATGCVFSLNVTDMRQPRTILARLSKGGPIISSQSVHGFWLKANVGGQYHVTDMLSDGTWLVENRLFASTLPASVELELSMLVGGITFIDGSTEITLDASDISGNGEYFYHLLVSPQWQISCHIIKAFDQNTFIGQR